MKFAVVGAGAIGAYVGAALARGGSDVTLIARGAHLEAMRAEGVRVLSPRGDFEAQPPVTDDLEAMADADVVFVSLKANSLPALAPRLAASLKPGGAVVWAQNGIPWWYFRSQTGPLEGLVLQSVDPGGSIADAFPPESVIGCVIYCSTEIVSPGVIRHIEGTRFSLGEPDGARSERCVRISKAFVDGGLKAPIEARIREQIWLKLLGNAAFNPISALTGARLGQLGELPEMVVLLRELFVETAAVATALDIEIPVSLERRLEAGIEVGDHNTSMLQDLDAGKPLELDCITAVVIELADAVGIEVPSTRAVYACAKMLDRVRTVVPPT